MTTNTVQTETTTVVATTPAVKPAAWLTLDQVLAFLATTGLPYSKQSGFIRVDGAKGNRLYIAATKTVRRIDISGFECSPVIAQVPHCGVFGNVKQQVRLTGLPVETQMANFEAAYRTLILQVAKTPAPKAVKVEVVAAPVVDEAAVAAAKEAAKLARIALIKKVAAEKGMMVSTSSIASSPAV